MVTVAIEVALRWGDLDAQGHINNVTYLELLQEARVQFLHRGGLSLLDDGVVVTSHQVEYLAPVTDIAIPVCIAIQVEDIGGARFVLGYTVTHQGQTVLRARTACAPFDFAGACVRRLGADERQFLETHTAEPLNFREVTPLDLHGQGYVTPLTVRWSDQDSYRHINNVEYYGYLQEARIKFTTMVAPSAARSGAGEASYLWLVARQDVDYLSQMFYRREPYYVRSAVAKLGQTSVTIVSEIIDADTPQARVLARSTAVLVCCNAHGPCALPESLCVGLSPYLVG
ncbi:MAG: acyl-CoA thioesterase [Propionibacteriaceae bacterium]